MDRAAIPKELDPLEKDEMTEFVQAQWMDLCAKLGERVGDFIEAAWSKAVAYELLEKGSAARFVNLCCALGPGFDRQPENEWALAILADERLGQWVKVHQLVVRGASELKRRARDGARISAQLLRADGRLLDGLDEGQAARGGDGPPAARLSCDLEAVELRLLDTEWRREYAKLDGIWKLIPLANAPPAVRINSRQSMPREISVLTRPPASKAAARLQVRTQKHSLCSQDRHPSIVFAGAHGLWSRNGHSATATSWPVHTDAPVLPATETPAALIEESLPQPNLMRIGTCGLRDEGVPLGSLETFVFAYPSDQWLSMLRRDKGLHLQWPRQEADGAMPVRTHIRLERDGAQVRSKSWIDAFHEGLDGGVRRGFGELFAAWQKSATDAAMTVSADLLAGTADLAWGWREGSGGLAGHPLTRIALEFDLGNELACSMAGEVALGATRTRVRLIVEGGIEMKHRITRQVPRGGLTDVLLPTVARWRSPYRIEFDPIAVEGGAMFSEIVSCTGAMVGECGLRPRLTGGNGWQWYAQLASESVSAQVRVHDPLLGQTSQSVRLLPELKLLDWSMA